MNERRNGTEEITIDGHIVVIQYRGDVYSIVNEDNLPQSVLEKAIAQIEKNW